MNNLDQELDEIFYQYRDDYNEWQANPRGSGTNGIKLQAKAKQAINAYILGEVMELIGEDDVQKPDDDEYDYPYCTTCDMCFFDGDKSNGCECTSRNRVRQELRNKANKKWGKL
jgi:hypothetical protein